MLHALAMAVALSTAVSKCGSARADLPAFAALEPPVDAAVESGPVAVRIHARIPPSLRLDAWSLVSDVMLVPPAGRPLTATSRSVDPDATGSTGTFFFNGLESGETYYIELHWREPLQPGCPIAKWTSMLGQFSTI